MVETYFNHSMMSKAQKGGYLELEVVNLRDFGGGPRKQVDDTPYGGGDGMVLKAEPIYKAIEFARSKSSNSQVILPTPRGKLYKQSDAKVLAEARQDLIIICPRYEGYDERIVNFIDKQFCIGNYVLTGGELPAMIIADSVVRLLPGVLGGETSAQKESFFSDDKSIEAPHYTRPEDFMGLKVPKILLSGHHAQIENWQRQQNQNKPNPD